MNAAFEAYFLDFRMQIQRQMQRLRQMNRKMVFLCPKFRHLSLECRFEAYFLDFRMQIQRQNVNAKANA